MRTWVKFTIAGIIVVCLGFGALAATGAYYFFRHLDTTRVASEADALKELDAVRARFGTRPPLLEFVNPQAGDIRINRSVHPESRRATTMHIVTWKEDGERIKTDVPLWLMRFSSFNLLSKVGITPDKYRLTVDDIAQYGPGIVADFRQPGRTAVLVWVE